METRTIENPDNFMQPYVYQGDMVMLENKQGEGFLIEKEYQFDNMEEYPIIAEVFTDVFYGRLSASGYMDCTDWTIGKSVEDVLNQLEESYGNDD